MQLASVACGEEAREACKRDLTMQLNQQQFPTVSVIASSAFDAECAAIKANQLEFPVWSQLPNDQKSFVLSHQSTDSLNWSAVAVEGAVRLPHEGCFQDKFFENLNTLVELMNERFLVCDNSTHALVAHSSADVVWADQLKTAMLFHCNNKLNIELCDLSTGLCTLNSGDEPLTSNASLCSATVVVPVLSSSFFAADRAVNLFQLRESRHMGMLPVLRNLDGCNTVLRSAVGCTNREWRDSVAFCSSHLNCSNRVPSDRDFSLSSAEDLTMLEAPDVEALMTALMLLQRQDRSTATLMAGRLPKLRAIVGGQNRVQAEVTADHRVVLDHARVHFVLQSIVAGSRATNNQLQAILIFSQPDWNIAQFVEAALNAKGIQVSDGCDDMIPGPKWYGSSCDVDICVPILTSAFLQSSICARRLTYAKDTHKTIIPIVFRDVGL